ncbi:MAG: hypothetical protein ACOYY3_16970 [Chloroflexota bacterium]
MATRFQRPEGLDELSLLYGSLLDGLSVHLPAAGRSSPTIYPFGSTFASGSFRSTAIAHEPTFERGNAADDGLIKKYPAGGAQGIAHRTCGMFALVIEECCVWTKAYPPRSISALKTQAVMVV